MNCDEKYMKMALAGAKKALSLGETPVGCVIVRGGVVVGSGYNRRETKLSATSHAEITAINAACKKLASWRLAGCTLYVTLEPCPMCAGAIINARIDNVVFGAYDPKSGAFGSVINLNDFPFNHKPCLTGGVLGGECGEILTDFFKNLRSSGKPKKTT